MNGLEAAMIITFLLLIAWLGGFGAGSEEHPIGWGILIIVGALFLFFLAMWVGTLLGIVSFG